MTRVYTGYGEVPADMTREMSQQAWAEADQCILERRFTELATMLAKTIDKYCNSSLCTVKYHVLDDIVEDIPRFGAISVLYRSPYDQVNVHIMHDYN